MLETTIVKPTAKLIPIPPIRENLSYPYQIEATTSNPRKMISQLIPNFVLKFDHPFPPKMIYPAQMESPWKLNNISYKWNY